MSMHWHDTYRQVSGSTWQPDRRPRIGITANYGERGSELAEGNYESVRQADAVPVILPPSLLTDDIEEFLLSVDGLVFSGGGDLNPLLLGEQPCQRLHSITPQRDLQELVLMRRAMDKQMPVLAICRGIQVMAAAAGGTVVQDIYSSDLYERPLIKHSQDLDRPFASHSVSISPDSVLAGLFPSLALDVNSFHHQAVGTPGQGMKVTALSPDGVVEAIESAEHKPLVGVQWHPECFWQRQPNPMAPLFGWLASEARLYREVRALHHHTLTLDTHCDTPMYFDQDIDFARRDDLLLVDTSKMRDGGLDASIMAAYLPQGKRDAESLRAATRQAHHLLDGIEQRIASAPGTALAEPPAALPARQQQGTLGIMRGVENGYAIGLDLDNLDAFRRRGVVYMTLCHNGDNDICDSAVRSTREHGGLSPFGRQVVERMNDLGMMVDLSHAAATSFYDALEASRTPIVCSHSSCRALCDHPRNLDDDQMRALARAGGVLQVTLYAGFLRLEGEATILDVMDHLDHAVSIMGTDHVGLGTDFDGGGGVPGLANASEVINFTRQLLRRRYSTHDIQQIWGGNFLRVMARIQASAR